VLIQEVTGVPILLLELRTIPVERPPQILEAAAASDRETLLLQPDAQLGVGHLQPDGTVGLIQTQLRQLALFDMAVLRLPVQAVDPQEDLMEHLAQLIIGIIQLQDSNPQQQQRHRQLEMTSCSCAQAG
jgi:hypothetical protein